MVQGNNLLYSFLGALQAAVSVELTLFSGYIAASRGLVDGPSSHKLSAICTRVFLPCLIIVQCGPELDWADIKELWILFAWSFVTISLALVIGWLGRRALKLPGWTVAACGINNANAMPLLLLESLASTGALDSLAGWREGETPEHAITRAKSYVLLYMIVQQAYGFAAGPPWLRKDSPGDAEDQQPHIRDFDVLQDSEHVGLLDDDELNQDIQDVSAPVRNLDSQLEHTPNYPKFKVPGIVKKIASYLNPPLIAAFIAVFIGIIGPLHRLFLVPGSSPLYASITTSVKNLGNLFTSLQMFVLGAQLYLTRAETQSAETKVPTNPGVVASSYVLAVRFVVMPAICISGVYGLVRADPSWLRADPMLWFVMMVSPSGPSALLLAAFAELVHVDEAQIAAFLFISYLVSPFIAVIVSIAIEVITGLQ